MSPENRNFLQKSLCSYFDKSAYVCCANETSAHTNIEKPTEKVTADLAAPKWLEKLRRKFPQPTNCGLDAQNRIFGGRETELNEFPWTVLLVFNKRK